MLVTHYNFHIYLHPFKIMYYDTVEDRDITLKEWRKKNNPNLNKNHNQ
jgi:hypothetical protein